MQRVRLEKEIKELSALYKIFLSVEEELQNWQKKSRDILSFYYKERIHNMIFEKYGEGMYQLLQGYEFAKTAGDIESAKHRIMKRIRILQDELRCCE